MDSDMSSDEDSQEESYDDDGADDEIEWRVQMDSYLTDLFALVDWDELMEQFENGTVPAAIPQQVRCIYGSFIVYNYRNVTNRRWSDIATCAGGYIWSMFV